ncbi:MAG: hypothetical protein R3D59_15645 [Paracoccaceae bacterium]
MTRKSNPASRGTDRHACRQDPARAETRPPPGRSRRDPSHRAHLPGQPGKGGFGNKVKPVPLPGKSRGR